MLRMAFVFVVAACFQAIGDIRQQCLNLMSDNRKWTVTTGIRNTIHDHTYIP